MTYNQNQEESIWLEKQAGTWVEVDEDLVDYFGYDLDADGEEYEYEN